MKFKFFHVDAFADKPFGGNQAGVCVVEENIPAVVMQQIASENNLPVTAFVKGVGNKFTLQWFTPTMEISLCGHGTLAAAHILWEEKIVEKKDELIFETTGGNLVVKYFDGGWIELSFPSFNSIVCELPVPLTQLFPDPVAALWTNDRYLIELDGAWRIRNFQPDFEKLKQYSVVISSRCEEHSPFDFVSRYFAVPVGIPEDPVTGSAHCSLAPYWSKKLGKTKMMAFQASPRGGVLKVSVQNNKVLIGGKAITLFKGEYFL